MSVDWTSIGLVVGDPDVSVTADMLVKAIVKSHTQHNVNFIVGDRPRP